jgi:hypothetical protein
MNLKDEAVRERNPNDSSNHLSESEMKKKLKNAKKRAEKRRKQKVIFFWFTYVISMS